MDRLDRGRLPTAYFTLQAVLGLAWWVWIARDRGAAEWFSVPSDPEPTIYRFALPDVAMFVLGSALVAVLAARGSRWAAPAAWCVSGAVAYATLWCVGGLIWQGMHWLGAAAMAPTLAFDVAFAARLSGARA